MKEVMSQITPYLINALVGILIVLIGYIGKQIIVLIPVAVDYVISKIGLTNYKKYKLIAWDVWHIVDEQFRLHPIIGDTIQAKITMFESLIKQKIPGLTDADIEALRQSIAGEYNKGKAVLQTIDDNAQPIENPTQQ